MWGMIGEVRNSKARSVYRPLERALYETVSHSLGDASMLDICDRRLSKRGIERFACMDCDANNDGNCFRRLQWVMRLLG